MSEVDGYERPSIGERFFSDEFTPPLSTDAAGPAIVGSAFFPAGYWDSANTPNQALRCGTTSATTGSQGPGMVVPCVPGRQYTWSGYASQGASNTLQAAVVDLTAGDMFNRNTTAGWGSVDSGGTWTVGGTASDYATTQAGTGGTATMSLGSVNVARLATTGSSIIDSSQSVSVATSAVASGATITVGVVARYVDTSNYYRAVVTFNTDQTITTAVVKRVAGVETTVSSAVTTLTHVAGTFYSIRFTITGTTVQARTWLTSASEPSTWDVNTTDTALTTAAGIGCYARLTTGNTNVLPVTVSFRSWLASPVVVVGASTANLPLEWDRLSVTFTATQPKHTVGVQTVSTSTTLPGAVFVDDVQLEQSASASAFTTSGSVIYPVFRGYVERWPRQWSAVGFEGFVEAPCVDAFAALNAVSIQTELRTAIFNLLPDLYYPLSEPSTAITFAEVSGNSGPFLTFNVSKYGPGTNPSPGSTTSIVGDPGGTGIAFTPGGTTSSTSAGTFIGAGPSVSVDSMGVSVPATIGTSWAVTIAAWILVTPNSGADQEIAFLVRPTGNTTYFGLDIFTSGTTFVMGIHNTVGTTQYQAFTDSGVTVVNGLPHLVVGVFQQNGTNTTLTTYVDGATQTTTTTVATSTIGGVLGGNMTSLLIGGFEIPSFIGNMANGTVSNVAIWNSALSSTDIATLWEAGGLGYAGETSGTRIARHLANGGYYNPARISVGDSIMEAPSWSGTIDLLTDSQDTTTAEQGAFWAAPDGAVVFESRSDRWYRLTPTYTLGPNLAAGQYPYLPNVTYDYDPTYVYGNVVVSRNGGSTVNGGTVAQITTVTQKYFARDYSVSADLETDVEAQYMADWIFNTHRAPLLRISAITLDPAGTVGGIGQPALWPVALSLEIGMRITVIRTITSANSGTGITVTADYFVEQISHDSISMTAGTWETTLYVSPIGVITSPPYVTLQPWLLGDTTYGVLDTTTVLGW